MAVRYWVVYFQFGKVVKVGASFALWDLKQKYNPLILLHFLFLGAPKHYIWGAWQTVLGVPKFGGIKMKIGKELLMAILIICSVFAGCTGTEEELIRDDTVVDDTTNNTTSDNTTTDNTTTTTDTVELPKLNIAYSVQDDYENIDENPQLSLIHI